MRDLMWGVVMWMHPRRRTVLLVSDACLAGSLWCCLVYFVGASLLGGQFVPAQDLHDTIVENTIKIQAQGDRIEKLESDQVRLWGAIGTLQTDIASVKADISSMKDGQKGITEMLYVILGSLIIKIVIDVMRNKQDAGSYSHSRYDDMKEEE